MTEEEAKTKWCPMLQVSAAAGYIGAVSNRSNTFDDHSDRHGRCLGSACMAWRQNAAGDWAEQFAVFLRAGRAIDAIRLHRNETGSTLKDAKDFVDGVLAGTQRMPASRPVGFCGLAGKP